MKLSLRPQTYREQHQRLACGIVSVVLVMGGITYGKVGAVSDTTPMQFTSLSASTHTVNVNDQTVQVLFTGLAQDDISGYGTVEFYYTSPSGAQVYEGNAGGDGISTFDGSIDFQQYAEPGVWKPTFTLSDASGNKQTLTSAELNAAGYNMDITVISDTPDMEAPTLEEFGGRGINLILYDEPETLQIGAIVTDNRPGEITVIGRFISPSGNQVVSNVSGYIQPENPNEHMLYPRFHPYSEAGYWSTFLTLRDKAGNTANIDPDDFERLLGDRMEIGITPQQSDTTPVTINNLSFDAANPQFSGIPAGGAAITVYADMTDNLSGIATGVLHYRSQTSTQVSDEIGMTIDEQGRLQLNAQLPPYSAGGLWLPEVITTDIVGNRQVLQHSDLVAMGYDLSINLTQNVSDTLAAGQTITTDINNTGATTSDPIQSSIQTPVEGLVSIVTLDLESTVSASNGYLLIGQQVNIHAPEATVDDPLSISFKVDSSALTVDQTAQNLAVFRNGLLVEECVDQSTANPDPCVFRRITLPGGDIEVGIHTTAASAWTLGFPAGAAHQFKGFQKPVKNAPLYNIIEASENVAVKFEFGNNTQDNILASQPITQELECNTNSPVGEPTTALSANGQGLSRSNNHYRYNWKTLKKWKNTCRQFTFNFTNGESASIYFKFKEN